MGLLGPNSLTWPVAALAALKSGGVLVPLNSRYKPAELRKIADDAGIGVVLVAPGFEQLAEDTVAIGDPFTVVTYSELDAVREGPADDFRVDVAPTNPHRYCSPVVRRACRRVWCSTNRTLLSIVLENTLTEEGFRPGTTTLLVLPLAFTPGLVYGLLITTVLGGTLVIEPELNPSNAVKLLEEHSVEAIFGVPLIFEAISRAPEFADAELSSLKTAIVGGAAVPVPLLKRWADKGCAAAPDLRHDRAGGVATATIRRRPSSSRIGAVPDRSSPRSRCSTPPVSLRKRARKASWWYAVRRDSPAIGTIRRPLPSRYATGGCTAVTSGVPTRTAGCSSSTGSGPHHLRRHQHLAGGAGDRDRRDRRCPGGRCDRGARRPVR